MLLRKLLSVIDNIIVDVFKIICCSEPTDSFMVDVTVAQLPGHSRGTRFYSRGTCPGWPPLGAATARMDVGEMHTILNKIDKLEAMLFGVTWWSSQPR